MTTPRRTEARSRWRQSVERATDRVGQIVTHPFVRPESPRERPKAPAHLILAFSSESEEPNRPRRLHRCRAGSSLERTCLTYAFSGGFEAKWISGSWRRFFDNAAQALDARRSAARRLRRGLDWHLLGGGVTGKERGRLGNCAFRS